MRWSRPENVHLTVRFLGEVEDALLSEVALAAREAASRTPAFWLRLGEPASFGGRTPRVLHLTVGGETDALGALQARLEEALDARGFGREARAFTPHLTLGRRKKGPIPESWCSGSLSDPRDWEVEELVVFSSTLTPRGPVYTAMARCPLEGEEELPTEPNEDLKKHPNHES